MIIGTHVLLYSANPAADRAFFRDILQFRVVDAGGGWLIFALPPAEAAIHPADNPQIASSDGSESDTRDSLTPAHIYLMCDDLEAEMERLTTKRVQCSKIEVARWGRKTTFVLPGGGRIGLYQPTHPTAIEAR